MKRRQYDPQTLVNTIAREFGFFRELHRIAVAEPNGVDADRFRQLADGLGQQQVQTLLVNELIEESGGYYHLAAPLSDFLAFVLGVQRPLVRQQLEKTLAAIQALLHELLVPAVGPELDLRERQLAALRMEVLAFEEDVTGHTLALTNELEQLRSRDTQRPLAEQARLAAHLSSLYVKPVADLLEARNELSARRILASALEQISAARVRTGSPALERAYLSVERTLERVRDHVIRECGHVVREVMPLLDRIREESSLLAAFAPLLDEGKDLVGPPLAAPLRYQAFGTEAVHAAASFRENALRLSEPILVDFGTMSVAPEFVAPVSAARYAELLTRALPVEDYFAWCAEYAVEGIASHQQARFLAIATTAFSFSEQFVLTQVDGDIQTSVTVGETSYRAPLLTISAVSASVPP